MKNLLHSIPTVTLFFIACLLSGLLHAQSQFVWDIGGGQEQGCDIIEASNGDYALAGNTFVFGAGGSDMYIAKVHSNGTLHWTRTVGGTLHDYAKRIIQTSDRGYAVIGTSSSFTSSGQRVYIVKLDSEGTLQWSKIVENYEEPYHIIQTTDGGYVFICDARYIVKLSPSGNLQWARHIPNSSVYIESIIQTADGGFAASGSALVSNSYTNMYFVKFDSSGTVLWNKTIGGWYYDHGRSVIQSRDGGYVLLGNTQSFSYSSDCYIVKLSTVGSLQWTRVVGDTGLDFGSRVIQITDGGYTAVGISNNRLYLAKLDSNGTPQWNRVVIGPISSNVYNVAQTTDRGFIVCGFYSNYARVLKFDSNGNTCLNSTPLLTWSGGGTLTDFSAWTISDSPTITTTNSLYSSGGTVNPICTIVGTLPISKGLPQEYKLSQNYPNPFNPVTKIRFSLPYSSRRVESSTEGGVQAVRLAIFDILGEEVATLFNEQLNAGTYEVDWNASGNPSGVYFYTLKAGDFLQTKKMVLIK